MEERKALQLVQGGRSVANAVGSLTASKALREGTTGQLVAMLPQVWAVASASATRRAPEEGFPVQRADAPATVRAEVEETEPPQQGRAERRGEKALPDLELRFYRKYTEALLRRYVQMSMESGRVSSVIGREVLGGRASRYRVHGFDDAVIFRLDVEKCLKELDAREREVLWRVAMQEYTQGEAALLLGISLRTCLTRYGRALDQLTGILLRKRLLEPLRGCQGL